MGLESLLRCAGTWRGTSTLQDPGSGQPDESASVAVVTPILGGRFVRMDYTWAYRGDAQEGSFLFGFNPATGACTVHWIDSWHMSYQVMACEGAVEGAAVSVRGSYAAPPGPDWGWRIDVEGASTALRLRMFNVSPDGEEYPAVAAEYSPAA